MKNRDDFEKCRKQQKSLNVLINIILFYGMDIFHLIIDLCYWKISVHNVFDFRRMGSSNENGDGNPH